MNLGLQNRIALVTGGAQGIGSAITTTLLKEGALVIYTSRNAPALEEFQSGLPAELQARAFPICNDLTGEDSIDKLCAQVYAQHGHIDVLVNNAGHTLNVTNPHCSLDDWRSVMRLNFEVPR